MPSLTTKDEGDPSRCNLMGWAVGFACSVLADQVFFLSLAWAAVQTGVPGLVGLVLAAGSMPRLLVLLFGGVLADSRSPKRMIIATDSGRAFVLAVAAGLLLLDTMNAWGLVVVAVAVGTLDGLFLPSVAALPVRIAGPDQMGRVAALRTITQRVGLLAGGPLAGWLIHLFGPSGAFLGSAALFALSVCSLALVTIAPSATSPFAEDPAGVSPQAVDRIVSLPTPLVPRAWADITEQFLWVRRDPALARLLLLIAGMNFGFSGPFTAGIPLLAAADEWGATGAGLLIGAFGVGAAASGLGLLLVKHLGSAGWVQLSAVATMGLAIGAVGVVSSLTAALAAALILGVASGVFGTVVYAHLLTVTPRAEVGRMMALLSLILEGTAGLSFLTTGAIATTLGARNTFLLGGAVLLLTTLAALPRATRRHPHEHHSAQSVAAPGPTKPPL